MLLAMLCLPLSNSAAQFDPPLFWLEVWSADSLPAPLEDGLRNDSVYEIHLWAHNSIPIVFVAVTVSRVYDGWVKTEFGLWNECSDEEMTFLVFHTFPGFQQIPSLSNPPASCQVASTSGCKQWMNYVGYFIYLASPGVNCRFATVPSADSGLMRIENCYGKYYSGAEIGCCAQYSGMQTVSYGDDTGPPSCTGCDITPVHDTTWGRIKTLYR
jgi:hypothetical protein